MFMIILTPENNFNMDNIYLKIAPFEGQNLTFILLQSKTAEPPLQVCLCHH